LQHLGRFRDEQAAARAWDRAAQQNQLGLTLNFPEEAAELYGNAAAWTAAQPAAAPQRLGGQQLQRGACADQAPAPPPTYGAPAAVGGTGLLGPRAAGAAGGGVWRKRQRQPAGAGQTGAGGGGKRAPAAAAAGDPSLAALVGQYGIQLPAPAPSAPAAAAGARQQPAQGHPPQPQVQAPIRWIETLLRQPPPVAAPPLLVRRYT